MSRIKTIVAAALLSWLSVSLHAAEPARLPFYEARQGDVRIYLLGTIHAGKADEPLRQEIAQALSRSSQLIMEISAEEMPLVAALMLARLCKDACLRRQLSAATFTRLSTLLPGMATEMERIPAWMMSTLLSVADASKAGLSPQWGTEQRLLKIWGNRSTRGLEKPEEQVEAMASFEDSIQREMLEGYLALPEERRVALVQRLYQIWRDGDAEALYGWYQQMNKEEGLSPGTVRRIEEKMISSRNQRFVERLRPFFSSGQPVFVAVGALHLGGEQGVLTLLRAQGFTVTMR
ncbi:MAG: TraB/GumN family protein [Burkholderiales bacterium]|nr:TraB/GumN family protein [Burkholderiales bacterium]